MDKYRYENWIDHKNRNVMLRKTNSRLKNQNYFECGSKFIKLTMSMTFWKAHSFIVIIILVMRLSISEFRINNHPLYCCSTDDFWVYQLNFKIWLLFAVYVKCCVKMFEMFEIFGGENKMLRPLEQTATSTTTRQSEMVFIPSNKKKKKKTFRCHAKNKMKIITILWSKRL